MGSIIKNVSQGFVDIVMGNCCGRKGGKPREGARANGRQHCKWRKCDAPFPVIEPEIADQQMHLKIGSGAGPGRPCDWSLASSMSHKFRKILCTIANDGKGVWVCVEHRRVLGGFDWAKRAWAMAIVAWS